MLRLWIVHLTGQRFVELYRGAKPRLSPSGMIGSTYVGAMKLGKARRDLRIAINLGDPNTIRRIDVDGRGAELEEMECRA